MSTKNKFKLLYEFELPKIQEAEETSEILDEQGQVVKMTKKVKKEVAHYFGIRRPNRSLYDEAEFYYNEMVGKGINRGLISSALLAKRLNNDGGVLSEKDSQERKRLFEELPVKEMELGKLIANPENEDKSNALKKDIAAIQRSLQLFEMQEHSLFGVTAEALARTKLINWWTIMLLHEKGEEWTPFFSGEKFEDRQEAFDDYEDGERSEEDILLFSRAISRAQQVVAIWHYRGHSQQEKIESVLKELEDSIDESATS